MKHNNSHLEMKYGTSSVRNVFKSSLKDVEVMMLTSVKIPAPMTSSIGLNSRRVNAMEKLEMITQLKKTILK